jgi:hypothetical protein
MKRLKKWQRGGTTTVTLRIPTELNEWLDRYRFVYPQRIEKQTLVIEALKLLHLARGEPGTPAHSLEEMVLAGLKDARGRKSKKG